MKVLLIVVGRQGSLLAQATADFERRASRYWNLEVTEVKDDSRMLQRIPPGVEIVALTRDGKAWSSTQLASYLSGLGLQGSAGAAFLIGGAAGLSPDIISGAHKTMSMSCMTFTHELARLLFTEQLYRAGTIVRGEPYHKART